MNQPKPEFLERILNADTCCPFCGSKHVESTGVWSLFSYSASCELTCMTCGGIWEQLHEIAGIRWKDNDTSVYYRKSQL